MGYRRKLVNRESFGSVDLIFRLKLRAAGTWSGMNLLSTIVEVDLLAIPWGIVMDGHEMCQVVYLSVVRWKIVIEVGKSEAEMDCR